MDFLHMLKWNLQDHCADTVKREPEIGDPVVNINGRGSSDSMCWMLPARAIGYVAEVDENFVYKGTDNYLIFQNLYVIEQGCTFLLANYPFDTQRCRIEVSFNQIRGNGI